MYFITHVVTSAFLCKVLLGLVTDECVPSIPVLGHQRDYHRGENNKNTSICEWDCRREWLCDPAYVISDQEADALESIVENVRGDGSCNEHPKVYIAVVVDRFFNSTIGSTYDLNVQEYLKQNSQEFKNCKTDMLIYVSSSDGQVFIDISNSVSPYSDLRCVQAAPENIKALFVEEKVYDGLTAMMTRYSKMSPGKSCSHRSEDINTTSVAIGMGICALFVSLIIAFVCFCRNSAGCHVGTDDDESIL